jgi:hypothetical protein
LLCGGAPLCAVAASADEPWVDFRAIVKTVSSTGSGPELVERADGFAQARLNFRLPVSWEEVSRKTWVESRLRVLRSIHFVPLRDDFRSFSFLLIFLFRQVLGDFPNEND